MAAIQLDLLEEGSTVLDCTNALCRITQPTVMNPCSSIINELIQSRDYWHKVTVLNVEAQNKEITLLRIMGVVYPAEMGPVLCKIVGQNLEFIVHACSFAIDKLCRLNMTIEDNQGPTLHLRIQLGFAYRSEYSFNIPRLLARVIKNRYYENTKHLDLSSFHRDPVLVNKAFCPLCSVKDVKLVLVTALHLKCTYKSVNLANNFFGQINAGIENWPVENLEKIDLRYNKISSLRDISPLKAATMLKEIWLDENPVCEKYDTEYSYIKKNNYSIKNLIKTNHGDCIPPGKKSGIYQINCQNCDQFYIGRTKRNIDTRVKVHVRNIKNCQIEKSAVASHVWEYNHEISKEPKLLKSVSKHKDLEIWEKIYIEKFKNSLMNFEIPEEDSLIRKFIKSPPGAQRIFLSRIWQLTMCLKMGRRLLETRHTKIWDMKEIIPTLTILDGVVLPGIPRHRKNFLQEKDDNPLADQFLRYYFTLYDSNRIELKGLYHKEALFSLTANFLPGQSTSNTARLTEYVMESRNLRTISEYSRSLSLLHHGPHEILKTLIKLPRSEHDPYSMKVDVVHYLNQVNLSVSGVFKEPVVTKASLIRSFSRVFVLTEVAPKEYQIVNELLNVRNATSEEAEKAFKIKKPFIDPALTKPKSELRSEADKDKMTEVLSNLSKMNRKWSRKCLDETNWDVAEALIVFTELYKMSKIPEEAFIME